MKKSQKRDITQEEAPIPEEVGAVQSDCDQETTDGHLKSGLSTEVLENQNQKLMEAYTTIKQKEYHLNVANQRMEQLIAKLEAKNEELRSFAHLVAHDLKSPLNVVFLAVEMACVSDAASDEEMKENLEMIRSSAEHMKSTINHYLEYAVASVHEDRKENVDMKNMIDRTLDFLNPLEDVELTVGNMPVVYYDPVPLEKVVVNLVDNALKYNQKPRRKVTIDCQEHKHHFEISIADNGHGIPADESKDIFDPYRSIGKGRSKGQGTGLGLSLVKKIVERNKGKIWLESTMGEGTTFYFTIPKPS